MVPTFERKSLNCNYFFATVQLQKSLKLVKLHKLLTDVVITLANHDLICGKSNGTLWICWIVLPKHEEPNSQNPKPIIFILCCQEHELDHVESDPHLALVSSFVPLCLFNGFPSVKVNTSCSPLHLFFYFWDGSVTKKYIKAFFTKSLPFFLFPIIKSPHHQKNMLLMVYFFSRKNFYCLLLYFMSAYTSLFAIFQNVLSFSNNNFNFHTSCRVFISQWYVFIENYKKIYNSGYLPFYFINLFPRSH